MRPTAANLADRVGLVIQDVVLKVDVAPSQNQGPCEWPFPRWATRLGSWSIIMVSHSNPSGTGQAWGGDQVGGRGRQPGVFKFTGFRGQVGGGKPHRRFLPWRH